MPNGHEDIALVESENTRVLKRMEAWDEDSVETKCHNHAPIIEGFGRLFELMVLLLNRTNRKPSEPTKKLGIGKGLITFEGFDVRDIGRILVAALIIAYILKEWGVEIPLPQ